MGQPPVKVDRVLRDGDQVRLGDVLLTAHHTPGHTHGATTWTTTIAEGGKTYAVVFPDGGPRGLPAVRCSEGLRADS